MKLKSLFNLTKGHLLGYIILIFLVIFHRLSYSYVPLFTQYLIRVLYLEFDPTGIESGAVNLPEFLIKFFQSGETIMQIALYIALSLIIFQAFRYSLMYLENYLRGSFQDKIAKNLRVKLFSHIHL